MAVWTMDVSLALLKPRTGDPFIDGLVRVQYLEQVKGRAPDRFPAARCLKDGAQIDIREDFQRTCQHA